MLVRIGSREHFLITFSFYRGKPRNWPFSIYKIGLKEDEDINKKELHS